MRGFLFVVLAAIMLSGCASAPERDRNMVIGAGIGAGIGALIGSASGGPPGGWAGAAIGGATGGTIGAMVGHQACYIRNKRGELWQRDLTERCLDERALAGPSEGEALRL